MININFTAKYEINYHINPYQPIYEGGSESFVIGVITLLIDIIGCCIMP